MLRRGLVVVVLMSAVGCGPMMHAQGGATVGSTTYPSGTPNTASAATAALLGGALACQDALACAAYLSLIGMLVAALQDRTSFPHPFERTCPTVNRYLSEDECAYVSPHCQARCGASRFAGVTPDSPGTTQQLDRYGWPLTM